MQRYIYFFFTFFWLLQSSVILAADVISNPLGMRFVQIPAGEFIMGSEDLDDALFELPEPEPNALKEETPAHKVVISRDFYMGQHEVTQQQWLQVMENRPGPGGLWQRDDWRDLPVSAVSWFMAKVFIEELGKMHPGWRYRLPTEAEWEYVARDGSDEIRPVPTEDLQQVAWFINNSGDLPHPVGTRQANRFGVYDMLGNVWEWVADYYAPDSYTQQTRFDPKGPTTGQSRVRRGGSYHCSIHLVRPAYRSANLPGTRYDVIGFRIVAEPPTSR